MGAFTGFAPRRSSGVHRSQEYSTVTGSDDQFGVVIDRNGASATPASSSAGSRTYAGRHGDHAVGNAGPGNGHWRLAGGTWTPRWRRPRHSPAHRFSPSVRWHSIWQAFVSLEWRGAGRFLAAVCGCALQCQSMVGAGSGRRCRGPGDGRCGCYLPDCGACAAAMACAVRCNGRVRPGRICC